jgi:hypothetical protein
VRIIYSLLIIFLFVADISGQNDTISSQNDSLAKRFFLLQNVTRDGVTMPEVEIKEVAVVARPTRAMRSDFRKYQRLVSNLKRVYPYAYMVRQKLEKVNEDLKNIEGERERKDYIKNVEKDVFGEYEGDMRQLTITQGRLLIKLIDRETQNTSYDLIKEYRGWFSAAFWQGIARIFGTNLKDEYDAFGEDALIELIIWEIEAGRL